MDLAQMVQEAVGLHKDCDFQSAEALYRKILAADPKNWDASHNLGVLAIQVGKAALGLPFLKNAVEGSPSTGQYWLSYVQGLLAAGKPNDARSVLEQAIGLGLQGAAVDALKHEVLKEAAPQQQERQPDVMSVVLARFNEQVIKDPRNAVAHYNLGVALRDHQYIDEAIKCFEKAIELKPTFVEAINNLGFILVSKGQSENALELGLRSLTLADQGVARALIIACLGSLNYSSLSSEAIDQVRDLIYRALEEGWDRPSLLIRPALHLLKLPSVLGGIISLTVSARGQTNPDADTRFEHMATNRLLQLVLRLLPIPDHEIEILLIHARASLLHRLVEASVSVAELAQYLPFYCALASQCYINEYIYEVSATEDSDLQLLPEIINRTLKDHPLVATLAVACFAAYKPLAKLPGVKDIFEHQSNSLLLELLEEQVSKPGIEEGLKKSIPALTAIEDGVSLEVQRQYEDFPYPRWLKATPPSEQLTLPARLRRQFPLAPISSDARNTQAIKVLIAGCGTGRHAVELAQDFPKAEILAIDLSLTSLAYAMRMTAELNIRNIRYAQADLLEVGRLSERFDLVEAVGVLHHLKDPITGWQVLLSLVRSGGIMRVGLYSEQARQDVVAARAFIAEHGFAPDVEGIRACRRAMKTWGKPAAWQPLFASEDFYSTSSCRDLIFHIQEHRFTLPMIGSFIVENELRFLGFDVNPQYLAFYHSQYPGDPAAVDLANWHQLELTNPGIFKGMYQFYCQKQ